MKRVFIGSTLLIIGVLDIIGILITAALCLTEINGWDYSYPSRLWFLIFAGKPMLNGFADGSGGLGLGFLFICGIILLILGLIILAVEYVNSNKSNNPPPAQ